MNYHDAIFPMGYAIYTLRQSLVYISFSFRQLPYKILITLPKMAFIQVFSRLLLCRTLQILVLSNVVIFKTLLFSLSLFSFCILSCLYFILHLGHKYLILNSNLIYLLSYYSVGIPNSCKYLQSSTCLRFFWLTV